MEGYKLRGASHTYIKTSYPYSRSVHKLWRRPPEGWIKCNVYVSFLEITTQSKAGWVLRDDTWIYMDRHIVLEDGFKVYLRVNYKQPWWATIMLDKIQESDNRKRLEGY